MRGGGLGLANKKTTRKKSTAKKVTEPKQKVSITDILNKKKAKKGKKDKQESKEQELSKQTEGTLPSNEEVEPEPEIVSEEGSNITEEVGSEPEIVSEEEPIITEEVVSEPEIVSKEEPIITEEVESEPEIASEEVEAEPEMASEEESNITEEATLEPEIASEEPTIITEEVEPEPINGVETTTIESEILIGEDEQDSEDNMDLDDAIQGLYDSDLISDSSEEDQTKQDLLDALDKLEGLDAGNLDDVILDDLDFEDTVNTIDSEQTRTVDEVIHQENNGSQKRLSDLGDEQQVTTFRGDLGTLSNNRNKVGSRQVIEAKAPEGRQPKRKAPQPEGKPRRHRPVDKEGRPIKRKRPNSNAQGGKKSLQPKKKQTKKPLNVKGLISKKQSKGNGPVQTINKDGKTMQVRKAVRRKKKPIDKKLSALLAGIVVVVSIIVIGINVFGRGVDSVDYQVVNQSETMQQIAQETFGKKYIEDLNARPIAYFETQHNRILAGYLATLEHYLSTGEGKNHLEVETVRLYNNLEYIYAKANDKYIKNKQAGDTSELITNYERNDELIQTVVGGNLKSFAVRMINGYNDIPALRDSLGVSSDAELLLRINTLTDEMFSVYYSYVLNNPQPEIEQTLTGVSE